MQRVSSPWYVLVSHFDFITAINFLGGIHNGGTIGEFTTTATGRGRGAKVMRTVADNRGLKTHLRLEPHSNSNLLIHIYILCFNMKIYLIPVLHVLDEAITEA